MGNCVENQIEMRTNELITKINEIKGQYNSFKEYSKFEIEILKKCKIDTNEIRIEGNFFDKRGKSILLGKIMFNSIIFEISLISSEMEERTLVFEGKFDDSKMKYLGSYQNKLIPNDYGKFWVEVNDSCFSRDISTGICTLNSSRIEGR